MPGNWNICMTCNEVFTTFDHYARHMAGHKGWSYDGTSLRYNPEGVMTE